jgi:energy-coupling factor transport system substrate-specific component
MREYWKRGMNNTTKKKTFHTRLKPVFLLTLTALLITLSVVTRLLVGYLPNIQLTTPLIILGTLVVGAIHKKDGVFVGLTMAIAVPIVSNIFLGSGLWTMFQIVGWGAVALLTIMFRPFLWKPYILVPWAFVSAFVYGIIVDLFSISVYGTYGVTVWAYLGASIPFNVIHAVNNALLVVFLLPYMRTHLLRFLTKGGTFYESK